MRLTNPIAVLFVVFAGLISCKNLPQRGSASSEPVLQIVTNQGTRVFTRFELLASPYLKTLSVAKDPAYGFKPMTYQAVPLHVLFEGVSGGEALTFRCLDGFSNSLELSRILNKKPSGAIAYLAIESAKAPWPSIKPGSPSAGPFYVIWENPERSKIVTEEWPFQVVGFELKPSLAKQFPKTVPAAFVSKTSPIYLGYQKFMQNCFACHTVNGEGNGKIGPDLNYPHSPAEYMRAPYFFKLVRNPQSLHSWANSQMPAFDTNSLSDQDIKNIYAYLGHMAKQRETSR